MQGMRVTDDGESLAFPSGAGRFGLWILEKGLQLPGWPPDLERLRPGRTETQGLPSELKSSDAELMQ